jgi:hypothetical protein
MKRSPMPSRRTALRSGVPLVRRTPLRRTALRRSAPRPTVPVDVRAALGERSGGVCEIGIRWKNVCVGAASAVHHRIPRGMGGSHGAARVRADRLSSVVATCDPCHAWVHANPEKAELNGWILPRGSDSSAEPTWRRGVLVYLDDAGQVHDYESACA